MNEPPTYPAIITAFVGTGEDRQVFFRREGTAYFRSRFQYWPSRVAFTLGDSPSERDIDGVMSVLMAVYNHEDGEALIAVSGRVFDCVVEIPGHDTALSGEFTVLTWESDYTDERRRPTTLKRAWAASASMFRVVCPIGGPIQTCA